MKHEGIHEGVSVLREGVEFRYSSLSWGCSELGWTGRFRIGRSTPFEPCWGTLWGR